MKGYWFKIGLGALGIFVVGMVLTSIGRRGVEHVREAIEQQSVSLSSADAPFRVHGVEMGRVNEIKVSPVADGGFPRMELGVRMNPGVSYADLSDCILVVGEDGQGEGEGMSCRDSSVVEDQGLVEIGIVRLLPNGEVVRLFAQRSDMERKNWFRWFRDAPPPSAPLTSSASTGASFQMNADSTGAFMMLRDGQGKPVFQMNADSTGAFIQVRDSNGEEILRFKADSTGVQGSLHAN